MEVGRAGAQQTQLLAALAQQFGLLLRVGHVERLDPVDAECFEAVDSREHLVRVGSKTRRFALIRVSG